MGKTRLAFLTLLLGVGLGCSDDTPKGATDAGAADGAASIDARATLDTGPLDVPDSGGARDGHVLGDAGGASDAHTSSDSGPPPATGFTDLTPPSGARLVYVSTSGNDGADGLTPTTAKATIAAGYALLRDGMPDQLLLKRGDTWDTPFPTWSKSGASAAARMVVRSYGDSGARPRIRSGDAHGIAVPTIALRHLVFAELHLEAHTWDGAGSEPPAGFYFVCSGEDLLFEDNLIEKYGNAMVLQGFGGRLDGLILRRNIFRDPLRTDTGNTNIYVENADGLVVDENAFINTRANDSLEHPGTGTLLSHNAYLHESNGLVYVRGNIAYNARSNLSCRPGGVVRDNLTIRGGQGLQVGWATPTASTVIGNVVIESRDHWDGQPLGQGIILGHPSGAEISYNLVSKATDGNDHYALWFEEGSISATVEHNILHDWYAGEHGGVLLFFDGTPTGMISIRDNDLQQPRGGNLFDSRAGTTVPELGTGNRVYVHGTGTLAEYPDSTRTIGSYATSIGVGTTTEDFVRAAGDRSVHTWPSELSAHAVNEYLRAGYGMVLPAE